MRLLEYIESLVDGDLVDVTETAYEYSKLTFSYGGEVIGDPYVLFECGWRWNWRFKKRYWCVITRNNCHDISDRNFYKWYMDDLSPEDREIAIRIIMKTFELHDLQETGLSRKIIENKKLLFDRWP